ncbi:hypothetical protein D9M72_536500 [compost metagenome]
MKDVKFFFGQCDRIFLKAYLVILQLNLESVHVQLIHSKSMNTTDDGIQTRAQLGQRKRLGKIVVGTQFQPIDFIVEFAPRRNHNHGHFRFCFPHAFQYVESASVGQAQVQQHGIVLVDFCFFQSAFAGSSPFADVAALGKIIDQFNG